jgi:GTPase SAR1 family protein
MDENEYISYKKVIVFGGQGSGKTTLKNYIQRGSFIEEKPKEDEGKYNI